MTAKPATSNGRGLFITLQEPFPPQVLEDLESE
jgi:hypothetical protein